MEVSNHWPEDSVKYGVFIWDIANFVFCMNGRTHCIESPLFSFAWCSWYFKLHIEHENGTSDRMHLNVVLWRCEGSGDAFQEEIDTRLELVLRNRRGLILEMKECEWLFSQNNSAAEVISHHTTSRKLFEFLLDECDNSLMIVCYVVAAKECVRNQNNLSEGKIALLRDIKQLYDMKMLGNVYLIAKDGKIFVSQKEILSASSSVFRDIFKVQNCNFVAVNYPEVIVRMMLKYAYSGFLGEVMAEEKVRLPPQELYRCAQEYNIDGLKPVEMGAITVIPCRKKTVRVKYRDFAKALARNQHSATGNVIRMLLLRVSELDEGISGAFWCYLDPVMGKLTFEWQMWHFTENLLATNVYVVLYFVDRNGNNSLKKGALADFDNQRRLSCIFDMGAESLFDRKNLLFPDDVLRMVCELSFRFPDNNSSSLFPPVFFASFRMDRIMGHLLNSQFLSDFSVRVSTNDEFSLPVHRSVMSARSPVFRQLIKEGKEDVKLDMTSTAAETLVTFMYTGDLRETRTLAELLRAAELYKISSLEEECLKRSKACLKEIESTPQRDRKHASKSLNVFHL